MRFRNSRARYTTIYTTGMVPTEGDSFGYRRWQLLLSFPALHNEMVLDEIVECATASLASAVPWAKPCAKAWVHMGLAQAYRECLVSSKIVTEKA